MKKIWIYVCFSNIFFPCCLEVKYFIKGLLIWGTSLENYNFVKQTLMITFAKFQFRPCFLFTYICGFTLFQLILVLRQCLCYSIVGEFSKQDMSVFKGGPLNSSNTVSIFLWNCPKNIIASWNFSEWFKPLSYYLSKVRKSQKYRLP